jgi:hypothetical protein
MTAKLYTAHDLAALIPNRKGDGHVHVQTIVRRVKRGELPAPDVQFKDGTRLWREDTLRKARLL